MADSVIEIADELEFDVSVEVLIGPTGPPGPPGAGGVGGSSGYLFNQETPLATWTIPHGLGRLPAVTCYVDGEPIGVSYTASTSQVVVTWPNPTAGSAVLT